ncbi:MAG: hypothetical protein BGO52_00570 [Sphingobacteriales bacterium 44-61]|nr:MAG: hypothetical protein BGO52_00570 [Sphingobacteriales bacterium 44-61]
METKNPILNFRRTSDSDVYTLKNEDPNNALPSKNNSTKTNAQVVINTPTLITRTREAADASEHSS